MITLEVPETQSGLNSIQFNSIQFFIQIAKYILAHLQNIQYKYTNTLS